MYVDVAFPISQYQVFTYAVSKQFIKIVDIGVRVRAPIGKRILPGVIVGVKKTTDFKGKIRTISEIVDDIPIFDKSLWKLIQWISNYYITPIGKAATVIPKHLSDRYKPQERWYVRSTAKQENLKDLEKKASSQAQLLKELYSIDKTVPITKFNQIVASPLSVCKSLHEKGYVELFKKTITPDDNNFTFETIYKEIKFTETQKIAIKKIDNFINTSKHTGMLMHGVTGSGKTELYIKIAENIIKEGKSVIILLPEIALTPQIAGRIRSVFGEKVGLWHSKLTDAARAWTWANICNGKYQVIVGARSAIFAPVNNLGLVIVDEEQEASYKQEEPEPHYHARDVALMRAKINNAKVLLVSATPSLESYYNYIMGKYDYCYLPERFEDAIYPEVTIVDMIKEQEDSGKMGQVFSGTLQKKIEERLEKNEQIILLQNRRGYSPIYRCRDCGEIVNCPTCSIPLTYHRHGENLQCHFCGYVLTTILQQCNNCKSSNMYLSGTGTQKVEDIVRDTFPNANIARLDVDTISSGKKLTKILINFKDGKIDILLGTQMIAKGLDFGNVTLVGIINADTGLFLPDFRSGEKAFQLIYQAAGRSGRGKISGEVVIQTYNSDNPVIRYASKLDLKKYYNIIIGERKELNYPPFNWLAKCVFTGTNKVTVEETANKIKTKLPFIKSGLEILGPAWCYREKLRGKYRIQIVIKSSKQVDPNGKKLHQFLQNNILQVKIPNSVKMNIDIDPVSLL
jgi:primosomal protein N' (replication factor Y)